MSSRRPRRLVWAALTTALTLVSCTAGRQARIESRPGEASVGVYRARIVDADNHARRFRLLLYAQLPDRLHGEIVSPVGTSVLIVDGGGGRLAVSLVREGVSFVGPTSEGDLESLFGIRVSLRDLVGALLTGESTGAGYAVVREASRPVGLPTLFEIRQGGHVLSLRLKRFKRGPAEVGGLGTGQPPEGMALRPLEDLKLDEIPGTVEDNDES